MNDQSSSENLCNSSQTPSPLTDSPAAPTDHACEMCGRFDAVQIADRFLCVDCYEGCGSCCQESMIEG